MSMMRVSKNVYLRLTRAAWRELDVCHFGRHVEGLGAKHDVTE